MRPMGSITHPDISIRKASGWAFGFIGILILTCALLINVSLGIQKDMLSTSFLSYEQRLLVEDIGNRYRFLIANINATDMTDDTITQIRSDIIQTNTDLQNNRIQLEELSNRQQKPLWLVTNATQNKLHQQLDEVSRLLSKLEERLEEVDKATIPALRAGYNFWKPVDVILADRGSLSRAIGTLNIIINEAVAQQNQMIYRLYSVMLGLTLAGLWLIWFFTLRPLAANLERNYQEIRSKNDTLEYQANHDNLTDLSNRAIFMREMKQLESSGELQGKTALILIDIDNFKAINDNYGHHAGNQALIEFARSIESCLSDNILCFRLSGDEFAVIAKNVETRNALIPIVENIINQIRQKTTLAGPEMLMTGSIGVAWGSSSGSSLEGMFSAALE